MTKKVREEDSYLSIFSIIQVEKTPEEAADPEKEDPKTE